MTQCDKCRSSVSCERSWKGMDGYLNCVSFDPIITNGDKMRAMTDVELAEFCFLITDDVASYYRGDGYKQKYPVAPKGWLDWLRQEAKEGE